MVKTLILIFAALLILAAVGLLIFVYVVQNVEQPEYALNKFRAREEAKAVLVMIGLCTHLGCSPTYRPEVAPADLGPEWLGGYFCPCHGSRYDFSGRVYAGQPAPTNMPVPRYMMLDENRMIIGRDESGVA